MWGVHLRRAECQSLKGGTYESNIHIPNYPQLYCTKFSKIRKLKTLFIITKFSKNIFCVIEFDFGLTEQNYQT